MGVGPDHGHILDASKAFRHEDLLNCPTRDLTDIVVGVNQLHCALCGHVIGVYEPIRVFLSDDTMLEGSRLTLSAELNRAGSIAFHHRCRRSVADELEE